MTDDEEINQLIRAARNTTGSPWVNKLGDVLAEQRDRADAAEKRADAAKREAEEFRRALDRGATMETIGAEARSEINHWKDRSEQLAAAALTALELATELHRLAEEAFEAEQRGD